MRNMLFYRNIEKELMHWKNSRAHKPLILRGARQVGKTTIIRNFGKSFDNFIELNLEKEKDKNFFNFTDDVKKIFEAIILSNGKAYNEDQSYLIFIDEIQQQPKAIQLLRYFYEDLPRVHVISAGSLLEFALSDISSFPVGRVEQLLLYPLSFEEFLRATKKDLLYEKYENLEITNITHQLLIDAFNEFLIVGGMPEAVSQYIHDGYSFINLNRIFENIWNTYLDDASKYGKSDAQKRTLQFLLKTAPYTLDRVNFSKLGQNQYKSREISEAMLQLQKAKIVHLIYPVTSTKLPMIPDLKKRPRIQFLDTGLLLYINKQSANYVIGNALDEGFRGQISNHIAMQEIMSVSSSVIQEYYFWTRESSNANAEIDIVFPYKNLLLPVEVKAGAVGRLRSLHEYMDRTSHDIGIRLLSNQLSLEMATTYANKSFKLINIPIYLAGKINHVLEKFDF